MVSKEAQLALRRELPLRVRELFSHWPDPPRCAAARSGFKVLGVGGFDGLSCRVWFRYTT